MNLIGISQNCTVRMFLFFLSVFANALSSLEKRIIFPGTQDFHGDWELSDSATFDSRGLVLTGSAAAWCIMRLPAAEFAFSFDIEIPLASTAKVGVSLTRAFRPKALRGFASFLSFFNGMVQLEYQTNNSNRYFSELDSFRGSRKAISFQIHLTENLLSIALFCGATNATFFTRTNLTAPIRPWLSLIAESDDSVILSSFRIRPYATPQIPSRPPSVPSLLSSEEPHHIIKLIDNFTSYAENLANSEHLRDTLLKLLLPVTDDWQRRSLNVLHSTRILRSNMERQLNASMEAFDEFENELRRDVYDLISAMGAEVEPLYFSAVASEFEYNAELRNQKRSAFTVTWKEALLLICVIEGFAVIFYFISRLCDYPEEDIREPAAFR
jgi:hypothetical protein